MVIWLHECAGVQLLQIKWSMTVHWYNKSKALQVWGCNVYIYHHLWFSTSQAIAFVMCCVCCERGCLEIKCSAKYKHSMIQEPCRNDDSDFCLEIVHWKVELEKKDTDTKQRYRHKYLSLIFSIVTLVWTLSCVFYQSMHARGYADRKHSSLFKTELVAQHFTHPASTDSPKSTHAAAKGKQLKNGL